MPPAATKKAAAAKSPEKSAEKKSPEKKKKSGGAKKKKKVTVSAPPDGFKAGVAVGELAKSTAPLLLQTAADLESVAVGEIDAGQQLYVLDVKELPGGAQRAMVATGDPARGGIGGWVTAVTTQGTEYLKGGHSFVRQNAASAADEAAAGVAAVSLEEDEEEEGEEEEEQEEAEAPTAAAVPAAAAAVDLS